MARTRCSGERPAGPFTRWRGVGRGRATDGYGGVKGYDKLFVNDGSLLPGYLPERNIEGILRGRR
jgi:cholesterol oxidase